MFCLFLLMLSHAPFFVLALYCLLNFLFRFLYSALLYLALISWCTSFFVVCLYLQFHFFLVSLIWCLFAIQLLFFGFSLYLLLLLYPVMFSIKPLLLLQWLFHLLFSFLTLLHLVMAPSDLFLLLSLALWLFLFVILVLPLVLYMCLFFCNHFFHFTPWPNLYSTCFLVFWLSSFSMHCLFHVLVSFLYCIVSCYGPSLTFPSIACFMFPCFAMCFPCIVCSISLLAFDFCTAPCQGNFLAVLHPSSLGMSFPCPPLLLLFASTIGWFLYIPLLYLVMFLLLFLSIPVPCPCLVSCAIAARQPLLHKAPNDNELIGWYHPKPHMNLGSGHSHRQLLA